MDIAIQVQNPIAKGIERAVERVSKDLPGFHPQDVEMNLSYDIISRVLESLSGNWHPRATLILSELVTIGVCSRSHYGEQQLDIDTVERFAKSLEELVNCWLHE